MVLPLPFAFITVLKRFFEMQIVFKCRDFIVINKPSGMPSQKDPSGDLDAMSAASEMLKNEGENPDLWLIHRLDRVVGGLLVFARNRESAAKLSSAVSSSLMEKRYLAVCEGTAVGGVMRDYIFKDSLTSRAYVSDRKRVGFKDAELSSQPLMCDNGRTLVEIELKTGRFHQIRAQFSSRKMPLLGDKKYGSRDSVARFPALFASGLSFEFCGKKHSFQALPDKSSYPWSLFGEECYSKEKS